LPVSAEKLELVAQLQAARSAASATVHDVKLEAAREVSTMRSTLDADASAAKAAAAAVVASERAAADARRLAELEEAGQRRSKQVEALQEAHGAALAEVKRFYDDTSAEQLATIKRLKDEVAALRTREAGLESQVGDLTARCGATSDQLAKAMQEVADLRPVAAEAEKNKASCAAATARAAKAEKQLKNIEYELEVKTQLAAALKAERDELEKALDAAEVSSRKPGRILTSTSSPGVSRPGSSASTVASGDAAARHLGSMSLR
jgi:chromosome segregation ATPase